ncbi:transposase [Halalkalibaculum sp. DA384]|uniref:transposase n=1 Tax=Halalkalibaculum sp. DA384 TaxID=3373606 RepID=UPI0037550A13
MRKITQFHDIGKLDPGSLLLAVDVSSRKLDLYSRYRQDGREYEVVESVSNDLATIADRLDYYANQAGRLGYSGLSVVVEPSGRYEQKLTRAALQAGHSVWMVNPERMYKAAVVHHGDGGKSDPLDGKVLYMLGRMGKVARLVVLPACWQQLRQWGQWLEDTTLAASRTRIHIGELRRSLFVDWQQSGDLSWGATGRALQECYGFDPWRITSGSYQRFIARMKAHRTGIPERCLASVWRQAQSSCRAPLSGGQRARCSDQLSYLWELWNRHNHRKQQLTVQMVELVDRLDPGQWIPPVFSGFPKPMRAKILAETGPLRRFPHWRALMGYAGLKIRMRASGKYRGKDKITKKGRALLRKHLGQAAFALTRKDRLLGPYYHRKIAEGMPARKAKVACMRKLLKILYGAAKSNQPFNEQRVYRCAG